MTHPKRVDGVDIVALVSSAGGLDALSAVLQGVPKTLPAAVVVQVHLGGQGSELVPILRRRTGHDIEWAEDGMDLRPGRVLVTKGRRRLEVLPDGRCAVFPSQLAARERPHDALLTSLADSYGARGLAVVLSGMGNDGAAGARAMKAAGGIVIAQSEDTAEQPSMPRAAAGAGADLVLPLHEIAGVLADVVRGGPLPMPHDELDAVRQTFGERGEVARLAGGIEWSRHPLGPVHQWPPALRAAVRSAIEQPQPAAVLAGAQYILLFNELAIPSFGTAYEEVFGRPVLDAVPEVGYQREWFVSTWAGRPLLLPLQRIVHSRREGRPAAGWYDLALTPIRDEHGAVLGVFEHFTDRTEQVLASRRLTTLSDLAATAASRGRREALTAALARLADSPDVMFALAYLSTPAGEAVNLIGATGVELGGPMAPRRVVPRPGAAGWPLGRAITEKVPVVVDDVSGRFRGHLVGREHREPDVAMVVPLQDKARGQVVGVLVLGADPLVPFDDRYRDFFVAAAETVAGKVSESHARETELHRIDTLAAMDRTKIEFFANVSHEFRTPLTLMLAPLEEALRHADELPVGLAGELEMAQRNARRLLRLVGTLLDFSELEDGRRRTHFVATDLATLTREIVAPFDVAVEQAGLELTVDAAPMPEPVWVDRVMWEKIVANLVSNAVKFTWTGRIDVSLHALPRHAELVVRDTGVGIPAEELPNVLQRFHRVPQSRGRTNEGAGIGLALVDELVKRHHGRVRVTSDEGVGTTVTVWIPLGHRTVAEEAPAAELPTGQVAAVMAEEAAHWDVEREDSRSALGLDAQLRAADLPHAHTAGRRVLVVDGNADMLTYLHRMLGSVWDVTTARDSTEALDVLRHHPVDLVLADVLMPELDGFELLRRIRADKASRATPVILLTARAGEETAIESVLAGADDYIVKPFSARELVARVAAQLELARLRRQAERRFRALIDSSFDVVYRMSADWKEMRHLDGRGFIIDTAEPSTSWLDTYIAPEDQPAVLEAIEQAIGSRSVFELEHRVRRPDGSLGWTLSRAVPLLDEDGEIVEWIGTAGDVTRRHTDGSVGEAPERE
jgi:signal transduction histidine kinase/chemotaxis response regulator CheB